MALGALALSGGLPFTPRGRAHQSPLLEKTEPQEPLPDLVTNGYYLLGYDWRETAKAWADAGFKTPPVMITVANRTETAARVKYALDRKKVHIDELADPDRKLHIDSRILDEAEAAEEPIAQMEGDDEENGDGNGQEDGDTRAVGPGHHRASVRGAVREGRG